VSEALVSTDWLAAHLRDPDVKVLDGSWHMPQARRDPRAEFLAAHVPGAAFFDIDGVADHTTPLPHMLPTADAFADAVGALGVGAGDRVVVYDTRGVVSAARVWWTFRAFGHTLSPCSTAASRSGRRKAGRSSPARPRRRAAPSARRRGPRSCATSRRCATISRHAASRSSTRARPAASPPPSPSRAPGCAAATFPAASICPRTRSCVRRDAAARRRAA